MSARAISDPGRGTTTLECGPRPRLGLGLRIGLPTSLVIVGAMAALTSAQLVIDLHAGTIARRALFALSLAPLVDELGAASSVAASREAMARFHAALLREGRVDHRIELVDANGRTVMAEGDAAVLREDAALSVTLPVATTVFGPGPMAIVGADIDRGYVAERARHWRAWIVHLSVTAGVMQLLLWAVIRRQIARPIERLVAAVQKMQMGYWRDVADPGGAWELRWLGERFRSFGQELSGSVESLVAAQRRAYSGGRSADADAGDAPADDSAREPGTHAPEPDQMLMELDRWRRNCNAAPRTTLPAGTWRAWPGSDTRHAPRNWDSTNFAGISKTPPCGSWTVTAGNRLPISSRPSVPGSRCWRVPAPKECARASRRAAFHGSRSPSG